MNYFGYSDLDPLDFPEYSTQDSDTNLLYSPNINREFESSFMGEDYDTEMADLVDQFDPSTDTSVLSSFPIEDTNSDTSRGYMMGPVLKAMLEEWDKGDEMLVKSKKKRRKTKEKQPVGQKEDEFLY